MNTSLPKNVVLTLSLLLATSAMAHKAPASNDDFSGTWKNAKKAKACLELPLYNTGISAVIALDFWKWGVKYEHVVANTGIGAGSGPIKAKMEITLGDSIVWTKMMTSLARLALINAPLATDTWVGQQVAVVNSYVLLAKKEVRAKMKELLAVQKQQPVTLEEQRAQVSKIITLKAEIAELLA